MRSAAGGFVLALVLFGLAAVAWSEAGVARRLADAHQRLSTLKYDFDDGIDEEASVLARVPLPLPTVTAEVPEHRAKVAYWRQEYRELTAASPLSGGNVRDEDRDPSVMLIAANAAFRAGTADLSDRNASVERLDRVIQGYADVLRLDPDNADASYNYEFVSRFRDAFAKTKGKVTKEPPRRTDGELDVSVDLPAGPTIHGRPGGPPQDLPMEQFRTVTPMRFEEREELEPGRGPRPRRRG
jgi:hypothetical protein